MEGPKAVTIMDVGPRDGFQNITKLIPTDEKIKIVNMLSEAGVPKIETTSFVHPKWIPQLADSAEVFRLIQKKPGTVYSVLVPNEKGLDHAISSGVEDVAFVICASDALNMENQNKPTDATLTELPGMHEKALKAGIKFNGIVAGSFGCPYEGEVPIWKVEKVVSAFQEIGSPVISIADSVGVAHPEQVKSVFTQLKEEFPSVEFGVHLHDLMGLGIANAYAAWESGVGFFESAVAGLGGCPYCAGAGHNLATEMLVNMFCKMGIETGIDLNKLLRAGEYVREIAGENPELQHGHPERHEGRTQCR